MSSLKYNEQLLKPLFDVIYPIGTYYETSNTNFNPNNVWIGTWVLENDGTVLVSKSSANSSAFNTNIEKIVGEEKHTLIVNEIPPLTVNVRARYGSNSSNNFLEWGSTGGTTWENYEVGKTSGGNQAHNNVQPSKIVNRWHRTA